MHTVSSADGTTIAYDTYGDGPTLIYVTGATCYRNFFPIKKDAKGFAVQFKTINYDRRGRGDSTDTQPWLLDREIDDIEALIDANGGRAIVYGHSSGAILALEAALRMPDKIEHVVAYDPPYVVDDAGHADYDRLRKDVNQLLRNGKHGAAVKAFQRGIGLPWYFVTIGPLMPMWKHIVKLAPTLAYDMELTKGFPPLQRMASLAVPTTMLAGAKSAPHLQESARQLAGAIPNARLEIIDGEDHMVGSKSILPYLSRETR